MPQGRVSYTGPGLVIAIVGPDASGKTTLSNALLALFASAQRKACIIHLGGPEHTTLSLIGRRAVMALRKIPRLLTGDRSLIGIEDRYPRLQSVLDLILAYERVVAARGCVTMARTGQMVLVDRYPCDVIGSASGPTPPRSEAWTCRMLTALQLKLYRRLPAPHLVVRLLIDEEESVRRNARRTTPKAEATIRASHRAAAMVRIAGAQEISLASTRPLDDEVRDVLEFIERSVGAP